MTCRFEAIVALAEEMPTVTFNRSWTPLLLHLLPLLLLRVDAAAAEAAAEDKGSDATGSSDQGKYTIKNRLIDRIFFFGTRWV